MAEERDALVRIADALERIAAALERPKGMTISPEVSGAARAELERRGMLPKGMPEPTDLDRAYAAKVRRELGIDPPRKGAKPTRPTSTKPRAAGKVVPLVRRSNDEPPDIA